MSTPVSLSTGHRPGPRQWIGLPVIALGALTISIDISVVLLALPRIAQDLDASSTDQLWIVDIYGFVLAGLLITFGSFADRFGRRRMAMIGAGLFGGASVLAAFAPTAGTLILARSLCGVGAAALTPALYGLLSELFRSPRQRSMAVGVFMACFMGGMVAGPLIGGALLAHFPWGSVFLVGVPVMVLLLLLSPLALRETERTRPVGAVDGWGAVQSLLSILAFVYGVKQLARGGMDPVAVVAILAGLALAVMFVHRQRRLTSDPRRRPLLDLTMFRSRGVAVVLLSLLGMTLLTGPLMLLNTQYFQMVSGDSPVQAGLLTMPPALLSIVGYVTMPLVGRHIRPGVVIGSGLLLVSIALILVAQVTPQSGPWPLVVGFALVNLGASPLPTLGTVVIVGSVPLGNASSAASVSETSGQLGYALGIALLGTLVNIVYRSNLHVEASLDRDQRAAIMESLAGSRHIIQQLPPDVALRVQAAAAEAFCSGIQVAAMIAAATTAALGVVCLLRLHRVEKLAR